MSAPSLQDLAGRLWDAVHALDELRGDRAASEWTAGKVRGLIQENRADDPVVIGRLADALEQRLERERTASAVGRARGEA